MEVAVADDLREVARRRNERNGLGPITVAGAAGRGKGATRRSPVPVTGTAAVQQLIGLHGPGAVTRKGEPL
jgi:hypothetical protein